MGRFLLVLVLAGFGLSANAITYQNLFASFDSPNFQILPDADCDLAQVTGNVGLRYITSIPDSKGQPGKLLLRSDIELQELSAREPLDGVARLFQHSIFSWVPDATPYRQNRLDCSAAYIDNEMNLLHGNPYGQQEFLTGLFQRCQTHLARNAYSGWEALLRIEMASYNFCQNRAIRRVKIHLPDGHIWDAWLAMKNVQAPRPFVIVKCGIFCNPGSGSQRFLMMHFFDESPFNVLLVENITSSQFAYDNKVFGMGGYDEGYQIVEIAQMLMAPDSPLRPYISSLHVAAVSLGSHAALYASLYNRYATQQSGKPLIDSVVALCPVVDLHKTFENNFSGILRGEALSRLAWRALSVELTYAPALAQLIPTHLLPDYDLFPTIMASAALDDVRSRLPSSIPPPFQNSQPSTPDQFWSVNNFPSYANLVQTPTFLWSAQDDWLVDPDDNSKVLVSRNLANTASSPIQVLNVDDGNHCAFSQYYGWDIASSVIRSMILANSPESNLTKQMTYGISDVTLPPALQLKDHELHFSQQWQASSGSSQLIATFQIWKQKDDCKDPYNDEMECFRNVEVSIPFSDAGLSQAQVPSNETEAEALTRWANTHLRVADSHGTPLQESTSQPAEIITSPY